MDATLTQLAAIPEFWLAVFLVCLVLLCAIFYGFFLLWDGQRTDPRVERQLRDENARLAREVTRLRDILSRIERNTALEIENLKARLSL